MKTKNYVLVLIAFLSITTYAQSIDTNYYPPKNNTVSAKDYNKGVRDLAYAYAEIEEHPSRDFDYIDYWRVAAAYTYMGVDKDTVYNLFLKSKGDNKQGFCIILKLQLEEDSETIEETRLYKLLGKDYLNKLNECSGVNLKPVSSKNSGKSKLKKQGNYFKWNAKNKRASILYFDGDNNLKSKDKTDKTVTIKKDKFTILKTYKGLVYNKNGQTSWSSLKRLSTKKYSDSSNKTSKKGLQPIWRYNKLKMDNN